MDIRFMHGYSLAAAVLHGTTRGDTAGVSQPTSPKAIAANPVIAHQDSLEPLQFR